MEDSQALLEALFSDHKCGIQGKPRELEERMVYYGKNEFPKPNIRSLKEIILENFEDKIN